MKSVNQATLLGNVTRDPELRYTPNGNPVISFGLATNREWKNDAGEKQEAADFHNVVFWGKAAEIISQYVKKGNKLYVQGRLQTQSWDDKETGVKKYKTEIVGRDFLLLTPKGSEEKPQEEKPELSSGEEEQLAEEASEEVGKTVNAAGEEAPF